MDRSGLLERRSDSHKEGVPMVVTYSSCRPNINKILDTKRHLLERSNEMINIFTSQD